MSALDLGARSARSINAAVANGEISAEAVVNECLERVAAVDDVVKAWTWIDPEAVTAAARRLPHPRKADRLHGIPVGIKDVIDTATMPTEYGSAIYTDHRPASDGYIVTRIRSLSGVIMGKTATAEFAWTHPPSTTNPWNRSHTPGGSSSGSAAAVAAGMVPLAVGTQTSGSVIRPALFCGIVGFKPTFRLTNRTGVKPFADTLDTVGFFASDVADAAFFVDALWSARTPLPPDGTGLNIGIMMPESADRADPVAIEAVEKAAAGLRADGANVRAMEPPPWFEEVFELQQTIAAFEGGRALAYERLAFGDMLSDGLKSTLDRGRDMPMETYIAAIRRMDVLRPMADAYLGAVDAIVTIGANGEAPKGLATTGDSRFFRSWTALHTPAIAVPVCQGPNGLPVGVQVVASRWSDAAALAVAHRLETATLDERFTDLPR